MFFNQLDFIEKIDSDLIEDMTCIKRQLVIEFGDYSIATVVYALDITVEIFVSILTNQLNDLLVKNNSLPEKY